MLVLTSGSLEDKLVKGEDFASGLQDSGSSSLSHSEGSNGELGDIQKSNIISHSSNNHNSSLSIILVKI